MRGYALKIDEDQVQRTAAVTGASRGIGRATALELARRGYRVFALARTERDLQTLTDEASRSGASIVPVVADIGDDASRDHAQATIMEATGGYGIDLIVNNAGYGHMGPVEEVSTEDLRRQLEVNVIAPLAFTRAFLPRMRERRRGHVINISSNSTHVVAPFSGIYAASKAALDAASDALRLELYPFRVHVVLVEPGPIPTGFRDVSRQLWPRIEESPYKPYIDRLENSKKGWYFFEGSAESVAQVVARAAESENPRARYTITLPAKLAVVTGRLIPDGLIDWFLRRALGLRRLP